MKRYLASFVLTALALSLSIPSAKAEDLPTLVVSARAVALGLSADGIVEALDQATVAAQLAGRIVEVRVDVGQQVKKGDLLMRIDAREAAETVAAARSQLTVAQMQFERSRQLRQQNFISQAGLDKARTEYDAARAAAAQAAVALGHATVLAPIGGIVARRHAEAGEMASPGKALVTIHDPAGLRVTAGVPQHRLREVRGARAARIEFPELGKTVELTSFQLLPAADAATHIVPVRLNLPASADGLLPGMAARVTFVTGNAEKLLVPRSALVRRGELTAVHVVGARGLTLRQLRVGEAVPSGEIEILAGLAAGERIVVDAVKAGIALKAAAALPQ